jgi:hypothetical protein
VKVKEEIIADADPIDKRIEPGRWIDSEVDRNHIQEPAPVEPFFSARVYTGRSRIGL